MGLSLTYIYDIQDRYSAKIARMQSKVKKFEAASISASRSINGGLGKAYNNTNKLYKGMFNIKNAILAVGIAWAGSKILSFPIEKAAFLEDQLASYTVLLGGNAKAASSLVKQLNIVGAQTPFEFSDLSRSVNMMLGFGAATEKNVIEKVKRLGDISQGSAEKLAGISLAYSQIHAQGKAMGQDINQLINAGVSIKEMAKAVGMNVRQFKALQSQGKITPKLIDKAFKVMTSKGGMFYKMMETKSKTFNGLWSTMQDSIGLTAEKIGTKLLPYAKELVKEITKITDKAQKWVVVNEKIIDTRIEEFLDRMKAKVKFVSDNMSTFVFVAKSAVKVIGGIIIANYALKTATILVNIVIGIQKGLIFATNAAFLIWNTTLGINTVLFGKSAMALKGNIVAIKAAKIVTSIISVATKAWVAAQWLLNAALTANPIGLIIVGVAALIGLFIYAYKKIGSFTGALKFMGGFIIKGLLTPINLLIIGIKGLLFIASKIPGSMGDSFGKAYKNVSNFQDKMNTTLTGNKSATQLGMIYDLSKQGAGASTWTDKNTTDVAAQSKKQNIVVSSKIDGQIGVSADSGTKVTRQKFNMDTGTNMKGAY
jgi:tape measure domain-containing protein